MKSWPSWHPGQELKAEHLIGLESFLLSRSSLLEEQGHGLDGLDRDTSISVRLEGKSMECEVGSLRGVTPSGQPIVLASDDRLKATASVPEQAPLLFDVAIEVNHPEHPEKLLLVVSVVSAQAPPPAPHPNQLDLGRFRLEQDGLTQARWPMVRRLQAVRPHDDAWKAWVQPIVGRIDGLLKELDREQPPYSLPLVALATELQRLAFEWPSLPVPALLRRLRLINWLKTSPKDRAELSDYLVDPAQMLEELSGAELPERLASFLEGKLESQEAEKDKRLDPEDFSASWVDRFWEVKFLRPMSSGTVELYIPSKGNPPPNISVQNRELTYVRSVNGQVQGNFMVYPLGAIPIKAGSVYRFRLQKVVPSALEQAEFRFLQTDAKR